MTTEELTPTRHEDVIAHLEELGLSQHEAEVYTAVLGLGEVSAGKILDQLPLHREQLYRALKRLVAEGLLVSYIKRKRSYYSAVNPDALVRKQEAKTALARTLQPYLSKIQQNRPQIIRTIEGNDALERMLDDIVTTLPKNSEYLVMGGVGELFYDKTKEVLPKYGRLFNKKNISVRIVAFQGQDYSDEQIIIGSQVRYLDQPMGGPTATVVYGNKVAVEIFDPNNLAVIIIENEYLADSYKHTFEAMWKVSKEK